MVIPKAFLYRDQILDQFFVTINFPDNQLAAKNQGADIPGIITAHSKIMLNLHLVMQGN